MSTFDYKKLTQEELDEIFQGIPFTIPPMRHQLISLAFASNNNRVAFLHGVGTGKTLTALWTAQILESKKILVVCPSSAFSAWERDISKYTNYSFDFLLGSGKKRRSILKKRRDIYIINYEGLKTIYCNLKTGKGWKIDYSSFIHKFDCVILDEVHKCKSYKSIQSNICHQLSKMAKIVIGLTGTPVDKSLLEAFNIYKVIDLGSSLGNNYFLYRNKYFRQGFYDWIIKPGAEKIILDKIARTSISFNREECFDLPEIQEEIREIEPTKEFLDMQHSIISSTEILLDGTRIKLEATELEENEEKFRQIRAHFLRELPLGFLYYKTGEEDKKVYRLKKNPKIESLMDLLEDTSGKVIIFYHFKEEGLLIQEAIKKSKILFIQIQGGQSAKDRSDSIKKFTKNQSIKYAIVQESAGSEGWEGYVAHVAIFFSPIGSPLLRKQCIGRIHRMGQTHSCLIVDLVLKRSIDTRVIKNRGERFNFVQETMKYIQEYGGVEDF